MIHCNLMKIPMDDSMAPCLCVMWKRATPEFKQKLESFELKTKRLDDRFKFRDLLSEEETNNLLIEMIKKGHPDDFLWESKTIQEIHPYPSKCINCKAPLTRDKEMNHKDDCPTLIRKNHKLNPCQHIYNRIMSNFDFNQKSPVDIFVEENIEKEENQSIKKSELIKRINIWLRLHKIDQHPSDFMFKIESKLRGLNGYKLNELPGFC